MEKVTKLISVNLDLEIFEKLRTLCFERRVSKTAVVNAAIIREIERLEEEQNGKKD